MAKTMSEEKIYRLAWFQAIEIWQKEEELAKNGGELAKKRAKNAWDELKDLERQMDEKGFK